MGTTSFMPQWEVLEIPHNSLVPIPFRFLIDGVAVDLTGETVRFIVKSTEESGVALIDKTVIAHDDAVAGETTVTILAADTLALLTAGDFHQTFAYECEIETLDRPWFEGGFLVIRTPKGP